MKKLLLLLILVSLAAFTFSCSTGVSNSENKSENITAESLKSAGVDHNLLLDKAYSYLKTKKNLKDGEKGLKNFFIKEIESSQKYSAKDKALAVKPIKNNFHYTSEGKFRAKTSMETFSDTLSVKVKSHLNTLNKILENSGEANIAERISDFESTIENEKDLTEDQLILLYSATRTAEASYKYWSKNLKKWAKLVRNKSKKSVTVNSGNYNNLVPTNSFFWDSVRDVAVADVAGAAYTWGFNAVPGGGQVAYGSTIAGTAAASSTYRAVTEIADAIFG